MFGRGSGSGTGAFTSVDPEEACATVEGGGAVGLFSLAWTVVAVGFEFDDAWDGLAVSFCSFDGAKAGGAKAEGAEAEGAEAGATCGNSLAIFSDGRGSGTGILRPRSTG